MLALAASAVAMPTGSAPNEKRATPKIYLAGDSTMAKSGGGSGTEGRWLPYLDRQRPQRLPRHRLRDVYHSRRQDRPDLRHIRYQRGQGPHSQGRQGHRVVANAQQPVGDGLIRRLAPALRQLRRDLGQEHWFRRHLRQPLRLRPGHLQEFGKHQGQRLLPQRPHPHQPRGCRYRFQGFREGRLVRPERSGDVREELD
ncbi:hypothetical protein MPH_03559 [Macrophomina phaseolina MS6]|uniref:Uncharacterized protein n=1 Tax=Macrophomina phaseolina (strain MS6) TaxID=1126212 RepID=K2S9S5_MACPH|nr:hypothetical protein MPH_03559 [Macrophomina phaseolina MS6]